MSDFLDIAAVFAVRLLQGLLLSLPTLLAGLLVAGALVTFVGRQRVARRLGDDSIGALGRAWLLGIVLPVCAIGVIPVLLTLRRLGAGRGTLVVLALAGPIVTPWTLGYFLDRAGIATGILLLAIHLAIALAAGWVARERSVTVPSSDDMSAGPRSPLLNLLHHAGRSLDARGLMLIAIGLLGVGTLATLLPANAVGEWLVERERSHALILSAIPLATYITPAAGAMQVGEAIHASTMPGLVVPLIVIGSAIHLGTIALLIGALRGRALVVAVVVLVVAGAGAGAIERTHYDPEYAPDDTHAFEDYGRPFHLLDHPDGALAGFVHRLRQPLHAGTLPAGVGVIVLILLGIVLRRSNNPPAVLPTRLLRRAGGAVIAVTIVLGVYGHYPPPDAIAAELRVLSADFTSALRTGNAADARHLAHQIDRRIGQIETSMLLRARSRTETSSIVAGMHGRATALARDIDQPDTAGQSIQYARQMTELIAALNP